MRKYLALALVPLLGIGLYAALGSSANDQAPSPWKVELSALKSGDMQKLMVHETLSAFPRTPFVTPDGQSKTIDDYAGKVVMVNFWATWCAPCREEMPALDTINQDMGPEFEVVTIASGPNPLEGINRFFASAGIESLPILLDSQSVLSTQASVLGLPVTVILDREGREVARLQGGADWAAPEARAVIRSLIEG